MKLTSIVDDFVTQVAQFAGNVFVTAFVFWRSPAALAGLPTSPEGYVSPITFFAACQFAFLLTLLYVNPAWWSDLKIRTPMGRILEALKKAIAEDNWKKLGLLSIPTFLVVAIHAATVRMAAAILGYSLDYRISLGANCYFLGFFYLMCTLLTIALLPWFDRLNTVETRPRWIVVVIAIPGWMVILRGFYSYIFILSHSLSVTAARALGVWTLGSFLFCVAEALAMVWMWPLAFPSSSRDRRILSPKDDVHDEYHHADDHHADPEQRV